MILFISLLFKATCACAGKLKQILYMYVYVYTYLFYNNMHVCVSICLPDNMKMMNDLAPQKMNFSHI